jgi:hypothetical protein
LTHHIPNIGDVVEICGRHKILTSW